MHGFRMELDRGARKLRANFARLFKLVSSTPFGSSKKHTGCPRTIIRNRSLLKRSLIQRSRIPLFLNIFHGEITPICVTPQITGQPVSRGYALEYSRSRRVEFTVQVGLEQASWLVVFGRRIIGNRGYVAFGSLIVSSEEHGISRSTGCFSVARERLECCILLLLILCAIWGERCWYCFACQSATFDRESTGPRLTYWNRQTTLCTVEFPHKIGLDSLVRKDAVHFSINTALLS